MKLKHRLKEKLGQTKVFAKFQPKLKLVTENETLQKVVKKVQNMIGVWI